jgi:hypothetical protein
MLGDYTNEKHNKVYFGADVLMNSFTYERLPEITDSNMIDLAGAKAFNKKKRIWQRNSYCRGKMRRNCRIFYQRIVKN